MWTPQSQSQAGIPALLDGNNTCCIVQTDTSSAGVRVGSLQPEGYEEQVLTVAKHRVSKTDSRQRLTERERMTVLEGIKHLRHYAAGSTHVPIS